MRLKLKTEHDNQHQNMNLQMISAMLWVTKPVFVTSILLIKTMLFCVL